MCCKSLFNPDRIGTVVYTCGCGWAAQDPKWILDKERDSLTFQVVNGQMSPVMDSKSPHYATCPRCGVEEGGEVILLDLRRIPVKKQVPSKFDPTKTWEKTVWQWNTVARLGDDVFVSEFARTSFAWRIFWEAVRYCNAQVPKKGDFTDKRVWKAKRRAVVQSHRISIREMLMAMLKDEHIIKGESIREKLKALLRGIGVDGQLSMDAKLPILRMAWSAACKRAKDDGLIGRIAPRLIDEVLEILNDRIERNKERDIMEDIANNLINLQEQGATHNSWNLLWMLRRHPFKIHEVRFAPQWTHEVTNKVTREFWANNAVLEHELKDGEFALDRGGLRVREDGVFVFDPIHKFWRWVGPDTDHIREVSLVEAMGDPEDEDELMDEPDFEEEDEDEDEEDELEGVA